MAQKIQTNNAQQWYNCWGEYMWTRDQQKSVTDYALASDKCYDRYESMNSDKEQEQIDILNHNLI